MGTGTPLDLDGFRQLLPDSGALQAQAELMKTAAEDIESIASSTAGIWDGLQGSGVYSAPGQEQVFGAFAPVRTRGSELLTAVAEASSAMKGFAEAAEDIRRRFNSEVVPGAESFLAETAGEATREWDDDDELVERQNFLVSRMNALAADLDAAQRACARALGSIELGGSVCAPIPEQRTPGDRLGLLHAMGRGSGIIPETDRGLTRRQLDAAKPGDLPWGWKVERDNGSSHIQKGVQDQVRGIADDAVVLAGGHGVEAQLDLLQGSAFFLGALTGGPRANANRERLLREMVHTELFKTDPLRALGRLSFDLGTVLIPGGLAAKGGAWLRTGTPPGIHSVREAQPDLLDDLLSLYGAEPEQPPPFPAGLPDQRNPSGVGRDPDQPPVPGDNDYGNGVWENIKRREQGAAYQEYITGVKPPGAGLATEYVLPSENAFRNRVEFDGHYWSPGPPPKEVFLEAKGRYAFMDNFIAKEDKESGRVPARTKLDWIVQEKWIIGQMQTQVDALADNPHATLEWYVADELTAQRLQQQIDLDEELRGMVKVIWEPHP